MIIGYYRCTAKSERNAAFPIHVLYDILAWEESVLRQRCLLGNRVASRPAMPHEEEIVQHSYRGVSYKYHDIDELIRDEERAGSSTEFLDLLRNVFLKTNKKENGK